MLPTAKLAQKKNDFLGHLSNVSRIWRRAGGASLTPDWLSSNLDFSWRVPVIFFVKNHENTYTKAAGPKPRLSLASRGQTESEFKPQPLTRLDFFRTLLSVRKNYVPHLQSAARNKTALRSGISPHALVIRE